jgi:hypothetical protein
VLPVWALLIKRPQMYVMTNITCWLHGSAPRITSCQPGMTLYIVQHMNRVPEAKGLASTKWYVCVAV